MRSLQGTLLALAALSGIVAHTGRAAACGPLPCAQLEEVTPSNELVPLNTQIRVHYFGSLDPSSEPIRCGVDLTRVRLVPSDGETIELSGTMQRGLDPARSWLIVTPPAPLPPDTDYDVQLLTRPGSNEACRCDEREWNTITTFTTGDAEDDVAPEFAGLPALTYGARHESASSCGEEKFVPAIPGAELVEPQDQYPGVRYNVYIDGQLAKPFVQDLAGTLPWTELRVDCGSNGQSTEKRLPPGSRVEIRAVDLAGNESGATPAIDVPDVCSDPGDTESIASRTNPACGLTPGASQGGGIGATLLLLALRLGRRKPARR